MTIFERVKELSEKQGKSLQRVSEDLGFSSNYFYRMKKQQPTAEKLKLIADYFNVSVDYLLGRAEAKPVNEPIDLAEVANSDDDAVWSRLLSSGGRPLTEKDKMAIKLLFSDKWDEITQKAKDLDNKD
ncbi:helix-turn-helix domain-containing protein [Lactococcus lactis]|uniref:helix-turn-helix domain-containing protein n=1 Tax=Lactococcus lactis TaxID=1358 RepID=UPI00117A7329|nr:helix-turn-helix transcriptional regulator [Lactococcus lactis]MCT0077918.1 XRE family transcriptional regulator [Lactococcus lactis subsp. lactis]MDH5114412.1 helix-turn-helix domain-containing protein [Lactococcus lactis]QLF90271.1 helix-turn-helix transcriptional regulator [Lactococcus lactis subsp. lactis]TRW58753.1 helix-turn-helix transcriptional regulator [Lactococcus lactis]TRW66145.1 helix-turn-helix transcriptional regulator [Lactococcus lactis]